MARIVCLLLLVSSDMPVTVVLMEGFESMSNLSKPRTNSTSAIIGTKLLFPISLLQWYEYKWGPMVLMVMVPEDLCPGALSQSVTGW